MPFGDVGMEKGRLVTMGDTGRPHWGGNIGAEKTREFRLYFHGFLLGMQVERKRYTKKRKALRFLLKLGHDDQLFVWKRECGNNCLGEKARGGTLKKKTTHKTSALEKYFHGGFNLSKNDA